MTATEDTTIYGRPEFEYVDVGAIMRDGHPDIAEGDELIVEVIVAKREKLGRPLSIMDIGSGSGVLTEMLAKRLPDCRIIANDTEPALVVQAEERMKDLLNAEVFAGSFFDWHEPLDVIISWGAHHHMPHSYLAHSHKLLGEEGSFIIGDEFCPEYTTPEDAERLRNAEVIELAKGHILASHEEIAAFKKDGTIPEWSKRLEDRRRVTLWNWYKFVIDFAIERGHWLVAVAELQITRDDLVTDFEDEHKISPLITEHELKIADFHQLAKHVIGNRPPQLQSFYIYEYATRPQAA
jgi:SAM-dependent methyltransferase